MKIRSKLLTWWLARGLALLLRVWFLTCRRVMIARDSRLKLCNFAAGRRSDKFVLCVWHDVMLAPIFVTSQRARKEAACLVSQHQDGTYLAQVLAAMSCAAVRGSSRRGGAAAVKHLMEEQRRSIVMTPDGPKGPRRVLKPGAVYLASQTGRQLVPGAYAFSRSWRIPGSWTDLEIPLPFSTVYVVSGDAISIPPDLSRHEVEAWTTHVQQAMDLWADYAESLARGELRPLPELPTGEMRRAA